MANKLGTPLYLAFIKGVVCGIVIYSAVASFRKGKDYMVPVCVVGFILCGAEHCIADLCYLIAAQTFSLSALVFLFTVAIGNIVGAVMIDRL